ncbi:hypothetical protein [Polaribacter sp. HL-MS24]
MLNRNTMYKVKNILESENVIEVYMEEI